MNAQPLPENGVVRVVIESITPQVDGGRFPAKRVIGDTVVVEADVFTDGHDIVSAVVLYRPERSADWHSTEMTPLGNDRFRGEFAVQALGRHVFTVMAWVDHFETWRRDLAKKHAAGQDLTVDFMRGAEMALAIATRAADIDAKRLREWAQAIVEPTRSTADRVMLAQSAGLRELARRYPDPALTLQYQPHLPVEVDRERARYSTWYELFPRSTAKEPNAHGTFKDTEARLPYVAQLGFDVLYLPPIHPIGFAERKGKNNQPSAEPGDTGSPWAIGAKTGGHKSILSELGTLDDFKRLISRAGELGIEIALDIAFQCSPDHPYVREHPEWFQKRPDGTIQYAENPPKKYQDIYPFHFESAAWRELWIELKSVVEFWIAQGVRIFRVDNPHTKPFAMWEWLINDVKRSRPDVIFLAEAFTRPKVMHRLAKLGYTQSYTYFSWRNTKYELTEYFTELNRPPISDFFRPNLWPNTPDILTEFLQFGGRPAFMIRLVLAATLGASYGIYGPAFELSEHEPREPGSEEYRDSEKYQIRHWDLNRADSLKDFIARVNRIRREHPALQRDGNLHFHRIDAEAIIAYSKSSTQQGSTQQGDSVLTVVNLDPHHTQSGWIELNLQALGLDADTPFQVHDLLSGARFLWRGPRNYVSLDPSLGPAHIFRVRRKVRTERDFDYFL
jgi:starch synthase (maltosyl-transferring)